MQEAYESVVEYFGENPKTTSPSMFFSLFSRFTKAYKVQVSDGRGASDAWGVGPAATASERREEWGLLLSKAGQGKKDHPHQDLPCALRKRNKRWSSGRRKRLRIPQAGKSLRHPR